MVESAVQLDAIKEIETLCRRHFKSKTLTEEAYLYMAKLVNEDCPRNASELYGLVGDFLTDGMTYTEEEAFKICESVSKILLEKKLIAVDQRDTIVAEKLSSTVTISKINNAANAIKDEDFIDPFIGMERQKSNYNS
jgi:hypothetical protein